MTSQKKIIKKVTFQICVRRSDFWVMGLRKDGLLSLRGVKGVSGTKKQFVGLCEVGVTYGHTVWRGCSPIGSPTQCLEGLWSTCLVFLQGPPDLTTLEGGEGVSPVGPHGLWKRLRRLLGK